MSTINGNPEAIGNEIERRAALRITDAEAGLLMARSRLTDLIRPMP